MKNGELGCAWGGGLGYVKVNSTELKVNSAKLKVNIVQPNSSFKKFLIYEVRL